MNINTKNGDGGMTSLVHGPSIPKSDDRIELLGTLDELMSHLGLVKTKWNSEQEKSMLESVQKALRLIMDLHGRPTQPEKSSGRGSRGKTGGRD